MSADTREGNHSDPLEALKFAESKAPDMEELIRVPGAINLGEAAYLRSAGFSDATISSRTFQRGALLDAGLIFANRIGGGEKPIINATIPVGSVDIELGSRAFLTREELDAVYAYQADHPQEFGLGDVEIDALRGDMLQFLGDSMEAKAGEYEASKDAWNQALKSLLDLDRYTNEDKDAAIKYIQGKFQEAQERGGFIFSFLVNECLSGIDLLKVRGIPIEVFPTRLGALEGTPSPFLDSGFHFDTNEDVTTYPHDHVRTKRLNMASVHLLSRGLSQMGGSRNSSRDQQYMTASEYIRDIFGKSELGTGPTSEDIDLISERILARARIATEPQS